MRVLFVGQNPSSKNLAPDKAFMGTKSGDTLKIWAKELGVEEYDVVNAFSKYFPKYNKLSYMFAAAKLQKILVQKILLGEEYDKIIALGKVASKTLKLTAFDFFELPHPSGRNRRLNERAWVRARLFAAKKYVSV